MMGPRQGSLEESDFQLDNIEDQHDNSTEDEETTVDESIKVEYSEASCSGNVKQETRKRRNPFKSKEAVLMSQLNQHEINLTMIQSGISKLLEDQKTPTTMLGQLKALKHCASFSRQNDDDFEIPKKHYKFESGIKQEPKQEYFEYDIKSEQSDLQEIPERDVFMPTDFLEQAARIATELQFEEQEEGEIIPLLMSPEKEKSTDKT